MTTVAVFAATPLLTLWVSMFVNVLYSIGYRFMEFQ